MNKNITHKISGNNFHGNYEVHLRGPAAGFILSTSQAKKLNHAQCNSDGCKCGGGYGEGLDDNSARVIQSDWDKLELIPA